ncbi:hypothetical protein [Synechococcus phage S-MS29]|nr:hypothetical protein [Synechococcus phage S-MS29]
MSQINAGTGSFTDVSVSGDVQLPLFTTGNLPAHGQGKLAYDTTTNEVKVNSGSAWGALGGGGSGGGVIRQIRYKISTSTNTHNSTSFQEVDSDYRVYITPTSTDSVIFVDYTIPTNEQCGNNTIFLISAMRDGSRTNITSVGPSSGSRHRVAGGGFRPGNGYDTNDMSVNQFRVIDIPNTTNQVYYGFHFKQESSGQGNIRFGYSDGDNTAWGWRANIIITATELAPPS